MLRGPIAAVLLLCAAPAGARVEIAFQGPEPPFTVDELQHAVDARAPFATRVDVAVAGDGLRVRLGGRERLVDLGDARGADAARIVAQGIGDLLLEAPAAGLPAILVETAPAPPPREPLGWRLSVWPSAGVSFIAAREATFAVACDLDTPLPFGLLGRRWRLATQLATSSASSYAALTLRPALGLALGPVALRAGPLASWVRLSDGTDALVAGGQAAALLTVPIAGRLRAVVELGGDLYANRVDAVAYVVAEEIPGQVWSVPEVVASTPRAVLRGGAGLAWAW